MKLKFFKPDKKKVNKQKLQKEMLREAIALLVLNTDAPSEQAVRMKIRNTVLRRLCIQSKK